MITILVYPYKTDKPAEPLHSISIPILNQNHQSLSNTVTLTTLDNTHKTHWTLKMTPEKHVSTQVHNSSFSFLLLSIKLWMKWTPKRAPKDGFKRVLFRNPQHQRNASFNGCQVSKMADLCCHVMMDDDRKGESSVLWEWRDRTLHLTDRVIHYGLQWSFCVVVLVKFWNRRGGSNCVNWHRAYRFAIKNCDFCRFFIGKNSF